MKENNSAVSLARVLAMLMIVGCHIANWLNISAIAQLLNAGIEVFLIISGYLYAGKRISNVGAFVKNRWIKLMTPIYVIIVFLFFFYSIKNGISAMAPGTMVHIFDLQGLPFLFLGVGLPGYSELAQTWFLTALAICYILMIIVKKAEVRCEGCIKGWKMAPFVVALFFWDAVLLIVGVQIGYYLAFFVGYCWGKTHIEDSLKGVGIVGELLMSLFMVLSIILRLFCRNVLDATVFYEQFVAVVGHIMIAAWIFYTIQFVDSIKTDLVKRISENTIVKGFDNYSYYIYLTHYMFFCGMLNINQFDVPLYFKMLIFLMGTGILSILLSFVSKQIESWIRAIGCRKW